MWGCIEVAYGLYVAHEKGPIYEMYVGGLWQNRVVSGI